MMGLKFGELPKIRQIKIPAKISAYMVGSICDRILENLPSTHK